jgi:chromosome segregation ATPase
MLARDKARHINANWSQQKNKMLYCERKIVTIEVTPDIIKVILE